MKLTLFIYSLSAGGAERVLSVMANHWAGKGHEVSVITIAGKEQDFYCLDARIQRKVLGSASVSAGIFQALRANVSRIGNLRKQLNEIRPDVAIAYMTTANIVLMLASIGAPWRRIGSEHIYPAAISVGRVWGVLRWLAYRQLDALTALTSDSATWLRRHTLTRKIVIIPNPIPWPLPETGARLLPKDVLPSVRKVVLGVGRLAAQKGFDILIREFSALAEAYPEWDLVILGQGTDRAELETLAGAFLGTRIFLPGLAGNVADWYGRADIYVLSSRFEGFGNTLAEALACACPVISFDCKSGPAEIIGNSGAGVLVPPEDGVALRMAMSRLMGDESLRENMKAQACVFRDIFSVESVMVQWDTLLAGVMSGAGVLRGS